MEAPDCPGCFDPGDVAGLLRDLWVSHAGGSEDEMERGLNEEQAKGMVQETWLSHACRFAIETLSLHNKSVSEPRKSFRTSRVSWQPEGDLMGACFAGFLRRDVATVLEGGGFRHVLVDPQALSNLPMIFSVPFLDRTVEQMGQKHQRMF